MEYTLSKYSLVVYFTVRLFLDKMMFGVKTFSFARYYARRFGPEYSIPLRMIGEIWQRAT